MLVLLSLPANELRQDVPVDDRSEAGRVARRPWPKHDVSSFGGRSTFFLELLTEIKHLQGATMSCKTKKAEIKRKTTCYSSPGQENWNTTTIRQMSYNQQTLCWKKTGFLSRVFTIGRLASSSSLLPGCTSFVRASGRSRLVLKIHSLKVSTRLFFE